MSSQTQTKWHHVKSRYLQHNCSVVGHEINVQRSEVWMGNIRIQCRHIIRIKELLYRLAILHQQSHGEKSIVEDDQIPISPLTVSENRPESSAATGCWVMNKGCDSLFLSADNNSCHNHLHSLHLNEKAKENKLDIAERRHCGYLFIHHQ